MIQAQVDREASMKAFESQYEFQLRQDFEAAISSLNARIYDKDMERFKAQMDPASGSWLDNNENFNAWLDSTHRSRRVLWLQGIPGAGKIRTVLPKKISQ